MSFLHISAELVAFIPHHSCDFRIGRLTCFLGVSMLGFQPMSLMNGNKQVIYRSRQCENEGNCTRQTLGEYYPLLGVSQGGHHTG